MVGLLGNGWQTVTLERVAEALERYVSSEDEADKVVADLMIKPKELPADAIRHTAACKEFGIESPLLSTWTRRKKVRVYKRKHREVWLSKDDIEECVRKAREYVEAHGDNTQTAA